MWVLRIFRVLVYHSCAASSSHLQWRPWMTQYSRLSGQLPTLMWPFLQHCSVVTVVDLHSAAVHPILAEKAWAAFVPSTAGYALLMGTAEKMHGRHQNHSDLTEVSRSSYKTGISNYFSTSYKVSNLTWYIHYLWHSFAPIWTGADNSK